MSFSSGQKIAFFHSLHIISYINSFSASDVNFRNDDIVTSDGVVLGKSSKISVGVF